jgi:uridine kinase
MLRQAAAVVGKIDCKSISISNTNSNSNRRIMTTASYNHNDKGVITLGIAGGTGAGKTTLARAIFEKLGGSTNCVYLTHDHYYRDLSHKPLQDRSKTNFDHPESLETDLLVQHLQELKQGQVAVLPTYDFATHSRTPITTLVHPKRIIIVEGILIFTHPALCHELDIKVFVDADSDTRVVRRIRRDTVERGRTLDSIMLQYETYVKPMHAEWVAPSKAKADVIINSENGHSTTIALNMLSNHLLLASGIVVPGPTEQGEEMDHQHEQDKSR